MRTSDDDLPRVLVVDDDTVARRALARVLSQRGYDVLEAESGPEALRELAKPNAPCLAVVDWNMTTMSGPELCRILRRRIPYVYVVLTTASSGRRALIDAINNGADGFVHKPVDTDELVAWLVAGQRIVALQTRLFEVQAALERRIGRHARAGTRSQDKLEEHLRRELSHMARLNAPLGVVLIDLDRFDSVEEEHGQLAAGEVLSEVPERCTLREYDGFGRVRGHEFVAVVPGAGPGQIESIGSRFVFAIAGAPFRTSAGRLSVTASAGCASTEQGFLDSTELLAAARSALLDAKGSGYGRAKLAAPSLRP